MKSYTPANHDILANLCINIFSFALLTFCTVQDFFGYYNTTPFLMSCMQICSINLKYFIEMVQLMQILPPDAPLSVISILNICASEMLQTFQKATKLKCMYYVYHFGNSLPLT